MRTAQWAPMWAPWFLLLLLVAAVANPVQADTAHLYTGAISKHFSDKDYNERHVLVGYQSRSGYSSLYMRNSFDEDTFVLGKRWHWEPEILPKGFEVGVMPSLVYGYRDCAGADMGEGTRRWCAWPIPDLTYTGFDAVDIQYSPLGLTVHAVTFKWDL